MELEKVELAFRPASRLPSFDPSGLEPARTGAEAPREFSRLDADLKVRPTGQEKNECNVLTN